MKSFKLLIALSAILFFYSCKKEESSSPGRWELQRGSVNRYLIEENNLVGYIDAKGTKVITPQFKDGDDFYFGYAVFKDNTNLYGLINEKGEKVLPASYYEMGSMNSNGLIVIKDATDKVGIINAKGETILPLQTGYINDIIRDGLVYAEIGSNSGYIDQKGNFLIKIPNAYYGEPFNEGYAFVEDNNGYYAVFDKQGKNKTGFVYENDWFFAGVFINGVAAVKQNGLWGFVKPDGAILLPAQYEFAFPFFEGLAVIKKNGKFGCIDMSGKEVIPATNDGLGYYFSDGLISVLKSGKWGFMDKSGKIVVDATYKSVGTFIGGIADVTYGDGSRAYIDKTGKPIWKELLITKKKSATEEMPVGEQILRKALQLQ